MQETEIASHLESALQVADLQIQVVWQEEELLVILNRSGEPPLEYSTLTKQVIQELKKLRLKPPETITFYNRFLGAYDPDWQTTIKIAKKAAPPPTPKVSPPPQKQESKPTEILSAATASPTTLEESHPITQATRPLPEEAETKLVTAGFAPEGVSPVAPGGALPAETIILAVPPSITPTPSTVEPTEVSETPLPRSLADYSFARNKHLVKTSLPNPDKSVAEAVAFFDSLGEATQLEVAPVLEDFFKSPDKTSLVGVPSEVRTWIEGLKKLGDREFKSVSVWLSRYCDNKENALAQVNAVFEAIAKIEAAKAEEAALEVEAPSPAAAPKNYRSVSRSSEEQVALLIAQGATYVPSDLDKLMAKVWWLFPLVISALTWVRTSLLPNLPRTFSLNDPCSLVTKRDIEREVGLPVQGFNVVPGETRIIRKGDSFESINSGQKCQYVVGNTNPFQRDTSLGVISIGLHPVEQFSQYKDGKILQQFVFEQEEETNDPNFPVQQQETPQTEEVYGIGEEAVYAKSKFSSYIAVRKGNHTLVLEVPISRKGAPKQAAERLALKIVKKLP